MKKLSEDLVTDNYTEVYHEEEFTHHAPHHFKVKQSIKQVMAGEQDLLAVIHFQEGPIEERGVNGVMNEDLLAMVLTRLEHFQKSEFKCRENENAIDAIEDAMYWLRKRTRERKARGVEGTHAI